MIPLLVARIKKAVGATLSDIEYLAIKEFNGKRVDVNDTTTVTATNTETDIITTTAAVGKDLYNGSVSGTVISAGGQSLTAFLLKLYLNGTVVETLEFGTLPINEAVPFEFKTIGSSVATGQIIKVTFTLIGDTASRQATCESKMVLWQEDTGVSPQV